jgi:hypothetical protein
VESRDGNGEKAEAAAVAAAAAAPNETLSPWPQGAGGVVTVDDEASSDDAVNMSEAVFTAAKRSPPLPSSQKSRMCAAMGLEMSSC